MKRVVSLLPSATEIVAALGCADWLVGRSHECDFPPAVQTLPVCTAPRLDLSGSSAEIDAKVKAAVADAASVYEVLHGPLADCAPDVILTQDQCEVCAVSLADVEAALCGWTGTPARIVSLKPMTLADVFADVERVADALGRADHGRAVADGLRDRARALTAAPAGPRPRVACIEWTDPLMAAGNWVPELVEMAGGEDVFGKAGDHAPWITWDDLAQADPDIIVFMPCGFGLERSAAEARLLMDRHPDFRNLNAARTGRVYATDANSYFNRPGPRLVESLAILRAAFAGTANATDAWTSVITVA
ncbi:cobalamin-binding protein [Thalassospiraceae bacterium LMO-SO8]|nr:cobalamin-binding protein [Alphaproteobacteria bacterium LMO-S08]WND75498.1 cobalamin-binding protein [Thalassospiraceae bacterium LMO-SO8]